METKTCEDWPCGTEVTVGATYSLAAGEREKDFWIIALPDALSEGTEYAIPFLDSNPDCAEAMPVWAEVSLINAP